MWCASRAAWFPVARQRTCDKRDGPPKSLMGKRGKDKAAERFTGKEAFRLITGHMPVMMAYIGAGQKYLFANRAYEQWFDLPPGGCEGRLLEDVLGKRI